MLPFYYTSPNKGNAGASAAPIPQPQSAQILRILLVSADLTADEISRNKQYRHEGELRRLRLRNWGEQPQRNPQQLFSLVHIL